MYALASQNLTFPKFIHSLCPALRASLARFRKGPTDDKPGVICRTLGNLLAPTQPLGVIPAFLKALKGCWSFTIAHKTNTMIMLMNYVYS